MKKVLLISDNTSGGAGIACRRLFDAMQRSEAPGCQLSVASCSLNSEKKVESEAQDAGCGMQGRKSEIGGIKPPLPKDPRPATEQLDNPATPPNRFAIRWLAMSGERGVGADLASDWASLSGELMKRLACRFAPDDDRQAHWANRWKTRGLEDAILRYVKKFNPDVINLHNIHLASFRLFERLPKDIRIIWTLHDMWPLTGYCVYSFDCDKYLTGCKGACPQWGKWGEAGYSPEEEWKRRERSFLSRSAQGARRGKGDLSLARSPDLERPSSQRRSNKEGDADLAEAASSGRVANGDGERAFRGRDEGGNLRPEGGADGGRIEDRGQWTEDRSRRSEVGGRKAPFDRLRAGRIEDRPKEGHRIGATQQLDNLTTDKNEIIFVAPSRWIAECARQRFGGSVRVEHIPYGVPSDIYKPVGLRGEDHRHQTIDNRPGQGRDHTQLLGTFNGQRAALRRTLGLPEDAKIILAGAASVKEQRKGVGDLIEAVRTSANDRRQTTDSRQQTVDGNGYCLVTFGGEIPDLSDESFIYISIGKIRDERLLAQYYAAADVFVLPTHADNLPNTLLEAMACGTPCVAYNTGGCCDIIEDGVTGRLVDPGSVQQLSDAIASVLAMSSGDVLSMQDAARKRAEEEFRMEKQADAYSAMF